jgi:hypothetical protein
MFSTNACGWHAYILSASLSILNHRRRDATCGKMMTKSNFTRCTTALQAGIAPLLESHATTAEAFKSHHGGKNKTIARVRPPASPQSYRDFLLSSRQVLLERQFCFGIAMFSMSLGLTASIRLQNIAFECGCGGRAYLGGFEVHVLPLLALTFDARCQQNKLTEAQQDKHFRTPAKQTGHRHYLVGDVREVRFDFSRKKNH